MEAQFYIDRQFDQAIWVDVEDGIVKKVYNDSLMEKKMNEVYGGKSISFLKEDFEERMKGTYHNVRSVEESEAKHKVCRTQERIDLLYRLQHEAKIYEEEKFSPEVKATLENLKKEKAEAELNLAVIKKILKDVHKYDF